MAFTAGIKESGQLRAGEPLESATSATTVRVKAGKTVRTDGPFAETREQLGGFYIVEAKDLDEAVGPRLASAQPSMEVWKCALSVCSRCDPSAHLLSVNVPVPVPVPVPEKKLSEMHGRIGNRSDT